MYVKRVANLKNKLEMKSQFLFGPRATGKTSYISHELSQDIVLRWDLLNTRLRRKAETEPGLLYKEVVATGRTGGLVTESFWAS